MKAREFFAATGRPGTDRLTVDDLIGYEEAQGSAAPDLKAAPVETKVASAEDIERVRRGDHLVVGGAAGGPTAVRDAGDGGGTTTATKKTTRRSR